MPLRVLVLTTRLFDRPVGGGEACTARLLDGLVARGHHVAVVGRGYAEAPSPDAALTRISLGPLGQADRPFAEWPRWRRAIHVVATLIRGAPSTMLRVQGPGRRQARATLARLAPVDVVIVDHLQAWPWIAGLRVRPAPMVVMHNLESDGYAERAAADGQPLRRAFLAREARLLAGLERAALADAAVVACLSETDAATLRGRAPTATTPIEVLPGFPQSGPRFGSVHAPRTGERHIGLLGTWSWEPNRHALDWLLKQVVPHLPPHCRLRIAGGGAGPDLVKGFAGASRVDWLGRVADAADFYATIDVIAVPAMSGSGVQEKAIEAIATGLPVVATSHALRGLGPDLPDHVHRTDDPETFARLCATTQAPSIELAATQVDAWRGQRRQSYDAALDRCLDAALATSTSRRHSI